MKIYCGHHFMIIVTFPNNLYNEKHPSLDFITAMSNLSKDTFWARRIENTQVMQSTRSDIMHRAQANFYVVGLIA